MRYGRISASATRPAAYLIIDTSSPPLEAQARDKFVSTYFCHFQRYVQPADLQPYVKPPDRSALLPRCFWVSKSTQIISTPPPDTELHGHTQCLRPEGAAVGSHFIAIPHRHHACARRASLPMSCRSPPVRPLCGHAPRSNFEVKDITG